MKYIFVTGGVVSGLGKGICAASLGRLLKQCGLKVKNQKFDPYLNVDPGTMSPYQHGEVFVTDDGAETDLDLGHYERFVDEALDEKSSVSSGKIFWSVLNRERQGGYLGGTVQIIPHVTDEIKRRIYDMDDGKTDVAISEIGGTVGDIESQPFLEAIRQFQHDVGHENAILIHVTLIPYLKASGEMKTKPTQASVKELQGIGIQPDVIVCRSEHPLTTEIKDKIALFCNVPSSHVLQNLDVEYLYIIAAILIICLGLWHFSFFPAPVVPDTEKKPERTLPLKHIFSTAFFLYVAAVGGYLSSVTAMHNWFVNYAVISFHMNIAKASSVFSLFFIFSALGSVFLARFIKRVGEFKIVFLLSFAAFFLFLLGLLWRQTGLYLIALCGFFLSVTYPTTLVNIHTSFHLRPCFMLGLIVTAGSAINLIFTFVLGIANDVFGAHASFYLVPLGLLVFSVSSFFIYLRQNTSLSEN